MSSHSFFSLLGEFEFRDKVQKGTYTGLKHIASLYIYVCVYSKYIDNSIHTVSQGVQAVP